MKNHQRIIVLADPMTARSLTDHVLVINHCVRIETFQSLHNQYSGIEGMIAGLIEEAHNDPSLAAVVGVSDTESFFAAIVNQRAGLRGPSIESILHCQDKHRSRTIQRRVCPSHTPASMIIDRSQWRHAIDTIDYSFPCFVKPAVSYLSFGARTVFHKTELYNAVKRITEGSILPKSRFLKELWNHTTANERGIHHETLPIAAALIEENCAAAKQLTIEAYINDNNVGIIGAIRSDLITNTLSFESFHIPCADDTGLLRSMHKTVATIASAHGLRNTLFNIEFVYDPQKHSYSIIEINSRLSAQFMPMINAVTGIHPLDIAYRIATRGPIDDIREHLERKATIVSSCFILRSMANALVLRVPTDGELQSIQRRFENICITLFVQQGKRLSDFVQDSYTFRYAQIIVNGSSQEENRATYNEVKMILEQLFIFKPSTIGPEQSIMTTHQQQETITRY